MSEFKAINTERLTEKEIDLFIETMRSVIGTSNGNITNFVKEMKLNRLHPLRYLLGRDNFTPDQLKFAEGIYCLIKNLPIRHCPDIWISTVTWYPNNKKMCDGNIEHLKFDADFAYSIMKSKKDLEAILHVSSTTVTKLEDGTAQRLDIIRTQIALMRFGFPEPEQFFISR